MRVKHRGWAGTLSVNAQVWLSYASFEATPASMLGEEQDGEASEAERTQAAAEQEGPAAAADREAHARRLARPLPRPSPQTGALAVCACAVVHASHLFLVSNLVLPQFQTCGRMRCHHFCSCFVLEAGNHCCACACGTSCCH